MQHSTWTEIDLDAIRHNLRRMQAITGTNVMAVVKANAYGHGALAVARAAAQAGAAWLGVARPAEGLELRAAGLELPILVLGATPPEGAAEAIQSDLSLTVFDLDLARAYAAAAHRLGRAARLHLKIDTGMGRLGARPGQALELMRAVTALEGAELQGIFTHYANADLLTSPGGGEGQIPSHDQLARFQSVLSALLAEDLRPPLVHTANSAAALTMPGARYDLVRVGIALYGLNPSPSVPCPPGFRPALQWKAAVAQVKTLPPGHGISYGSEYTTTEKETVAVVPVGYADGYRRVPKNVNEVLIRGRRAPVRGRVCMDQIVVGVSHIAGARPGDEVVLLGPQGADAITADDLAHRWGTINYDITSGIMARVPRVPLNA